MPVSEVFLLLHEGQIQSISQFGFLVLGRGSLADRLSLLSNTEILAGRLGSRIARGSVAGGPNLLTHGGS